MTLIWNLFSFSLLIVVVSSRYVYIRPHRPPTRWVYTPYWNLVQPHGHPVRVQQRPVHRPQHAHQQRPLKQQQHHVLASQPQPQVTHVVHHYEPKPEYQHQQQQKVNEIKHFTKGKNQLLHEKFDALDKLDHFKVKGHSKEKLVDQDLYEEPDYEYQSHGKVHKLEKKPLFKKPLFKKPFLKHSDSTKSNYYSSQGGHGYRPSYGKAPSYGHHDGQYVEEYEVLKPKLEVKEEIHEKIEDKLKLPVIPAPVLPQLPVIPAPVLPKLPVLKPDTLFEKIKEHNRKKLEQLAALFGTHGNPLFGGHQGLPSNQVPITQPQQTTQQAPNTGPHNPLFDVRKMAPKQKPKAVGCLTGKVEAHPTNCTMYKYCLAGFWMNMPCKNNTVPHTGALRNTCQC